MEKHFRRVYISPNLEHRQQDEVKCPKMRAEQNPYINTRYKPRVLHMFTLGGGLNLLSGH